MSCLSSGVYTAQSTDRLYPVTVQIQNAWGGYTPVSALADTGNEVTIMKREVADQLGLNLAEGEAFNVSGINGESKQFRRLRLMVKLGTLEAVPVTIGFAVKPGDLVENLLGNADILKSGKFVVTYDKDTVTYREKNTQRLACSSYGEDQETYNNLYDQLTTRDRRTQKDATVASLAYSGYYL